MPQSTTPPSSNQPQEEAEDNSTSGSSRKGFSRLGGRLITKIEGWINSWKPSHPKNPSEAIWDIARKGFWLALIVTSASVPAFIAESLNWGLISEFWQFFWGTLPLTISVAIIVPYTVGYFRRNKEPRKKDFASVYSSRATWGLSVGGILWVMTWLGTVLGLGAAGKVQQLVDQMSQDHIGFCMRFPGMCRNDWLSRPFQLLGNHISAYLQVYGDWTFCCCLIAGLFIDWIVIARLLPLLNLRRQRQGANP